MFLRVLVERRNLIGQLVRRDFEARFVGSVAGWLWTLIQPLVLLLSWVFVFMFCMRVPPPPEAAHKSYVVFLFCGYLPWMLLSETMQRSANCIVENTSLITKTVFPSEVLPVTLFLSSLISNILATTLAVAGVLITEHSVPGTIVILPVLIFVVALLATGVSWIASSLQVYLRDTSQVVQVVLTAWFWTTPIFMYESMMQSRLPAWAWTAVRLNPMTALVGRLPSRPPARTVAELERPGAVGQHIGGRVRCGRALFPPPEARFRRRPVVWKIGEANEHELDTTKLSDLRRRGSPAGRRITRGEGLFARAPEFCSDCGRGPGGLDGRLLWQP